jgi:hypothetical protein
VTFPADTITLPTQRVRADGIDPAVEPYERAIFSHPGDITTMASGHWIAPVDVVTVKLIAVAVTFTSTCSLQLMKNNTIVATLEITGTQQQMALDPVRLTAEVDHLWVQVTADGGEVSNLTVFVSFAPAP